MERPARACCDRANKKLAVKQVQFGAGSTHC